MVDRFCSLRHHTVVRCNYQNGDISGVCSTHTHCGKCFVTRSIQECDLLTFDGYHIRTDVLCDTTCLTVGYISLTDRIQQGSFSVVNVSHNADNRRSRNEIFRIFLFLF